MIPVLFLISDKQCFFFVCFLMLKSDAVYLTFFTALFSIIPFLHA